MAHNAWQPQSPSLDVNNYRPRSPDLTNYRPRSPDLSAFTNINPSHQQQWSPRPTSQYNTPVSPHTSHGYHNRFENPSLPEWSRRTQSYSAYPAPTTFHDNPVNNPYEPSPMPTTRAQRVKDDPGQSHHQPPRNDDQVKTLSTSVSKSDRKPAPKSTSMTTSTIQVKTKFPTARIKRIMQADEDVGKVAQVAPVVMAKALELFMIRIITASATIAKNRGSKRILPAHMKTVVNNEPEFDFLQDIVNKVPDVTKKEDADDDDDDDSADAHPKKRTKSVAGAGGRGRKAKAAPDDD